MRDRKSTADEVGQSINDGIEARLSDYRRMCDKVAPTTSNKGHKYTLYH